MPLFERQYLTDSFYPYHSFSVIVAQPLSSTCSEIGEKMRKNVLLATILWIFLLSGCATTAKYETVLNSWVGHDVNELISSWGYPVNSFKAPNGNTVYVYSSSGSYTMPTQTNSTYNVYGNTVYGNTTTTGGQTLNFWCRTFFEVSTSNKIVTWRWEGNNCTSR